MSVERFIKISKAWTESSVYNNNKKLLSDYGEMGFVFYIYCRLRETNFSSTTDKDGNIVKGDYDGITNIGSFLDRFGFVVDSTRSRRKKELLRVVKLMEKNNVITFYKDESFENVVLFDDKIKNHQDLYYNVEKFDDTNFIKLTRLEFVNIMKSESNRLELLVHFMSVMHYENNLEQVCYPSLEGLYNITGYAKNTCIRYNDMLRDLQVLYFDNAGMEYDTSDQQFKQKTNTYGRWVNKDIVDDKVAEIRLRNEGKLYNISGEKQELTNRSRSLSNKMRYVKDEEELAMLKTEYDAIIERKTKMESINYAHMIPKSLRGKAGACEGTKDNDSVVM